MFKILFFVAFVAVFGIVFLSVISYSKTEKIRTRIGRVQPKPRAWLFPATQTAPWELKYNKGKQGEYQLGQVLNQL